MNNNILINISYNTNFKPKFFYKIVFKRTKIIYCKNFFLFIFLIKYINNFFIVKNIKFFIKPFKKNFFSLLKAPYRYKLSKHQLGVFRYNLNLNLVILTKNLIYKDFNNFFLFLKKFKNFIKFLETNLLYNNKIKFMLNFKLKNYFNIF